MNHSFFDRIAYRISASSRARKHAFFLQMLNPNPQEMILDVGVNVTEYSDTDNYLERFYPFPEKITAVSLEDASRLAAQYPAVTFVTANGTQLPFEDNQFDIAFSNAVIEHVGKQAAQQQFLGELIRVSKRGYLTTPNKFFPFEVHTRVPLLHILLPKKYFDRLLHMLGKSWATGSYMYLLSESDLASLAQKAGLTEFHIYKNRLFGFTMTLTLIWKK